MLKISKSKAKSLSFLILGANILTSDFALANNLKIGGLAQIEASWFDDNVKHAFNSPIAASTSNNRFLNSSNATQVNLYVRGIINKYWIYNVSINHGNPGPSVMNAWVGWDIFDPYVRFSAGRFNAYQGLENTGSRSAYTFIAPAAGQRSFMTGRVNGFAVEGNPFKWIGYQAAIAFHTTGGMAASQNPGFGANVDSSSQVVVSNGANNKSFATARVFLQPIVKPGKVLHVGGTYSYAQTSGDVTLHAAPGGHFATAGASLIRLTSAAGNNGSEISKNRTNGFNLWGLEGLAIWGPLHIQTEYMNFNLDLDSNASQYKSSIITNATTTSLKADGWYVQGSWILTGESRNYDPISGTLGKINPRNIKCGAWELAARYNQVNFAKSVNTAGSNALLLSSSAFGGGIGLVNGGKMSDVTVGVNWYPNQNVKLMANYTWSESEYGKNANSTGPNFESTGTAKATKTREVNVYSVKAQVDF